jgi:phycobilisome rod-core linker protein
MANSIKIKTVTYTPVSTANIQIPNTTRETTSIGIPVSISSGASFPLG